MICIFVFCCCLANSLATIGCKDMNNQPVDWFIFYKLPKDPSANPNGLRYLYIDDNIQEHWEVFPEVDLGSKEQSVAYTLKQFYEAKNKTQTFSFLYNDQPPMPSQSSKTSQSKGILIFDNSSGFWMTHSIPQFPHASNYYFPESEEIGFAHMGICISFPFKALNSIGKQLALIQPNVYYKQISQEFLSKIPVFNQILSGTNTKENGKSNSELITISGGLKVLSFAKNAKLGKDLYSDIIAPFMESNLTVQSVLDYNNASNNLDSSCNKQYMISSSLEVTIPLGSFNIASEKDHSKFAVTSNPENVEQLPYVCVGDMDRQKQTEKAGGGAICLYLSGLWHVFNGMIS